MARDKTKAVVTKTQAEMLGDLAWNGEEIDNLYGSCRQVTLVKSIGWLAKRSVSPSSNWPSLDLAKGLPTAHRFCIHPG